MTLIDPITFVALGLLISLYGISPVYGEGANLLVNRTVHRDERLPSITDIEMNLRLTETYKSIIESIGVREQVQAELDNK